MVSSATSSKTSEPKLDGLGPLPGLSISSGELSNALAHGGVDQVSIEALASESFSGPWPHDQPWSHPLTVVLLACQNHADMLILSDSNYLYEQEPCKKKKKNSPEPP